MKENKYFLISTYFFLLPFAVSLKSPELQFCSIMFNHVQSCLFMTFEERFKSLVLLSWLLMKSYKKAYFTLQTIAIRMKGFPEIRLQHLARLGFFFSQKIQNFSFVWGLISMSKPEMHHMR